MEAALTGTPGWLVPLRGARRGELWTLDAVTVVGTDPDSTICIADEYMSSKHAALRACGGGWVLEDLTSTNGTYVNGKPVRRHGLVDNDLVRIGSTLCKFKAL
jgi:pSer/pThr/pTyr-binding forkhead associated (FHA) protein